MNIVAHPYVLAPGYEGREERCRQQAQEKQEQTKKTGFGRRSGTEVGSTPGEGYRATQVELTPGKRARFTKEDDVVLPHDLSERLTVQIVLEPKDPRFLPDDMVFNPLQHGRSLQQLDETRRLWRASLCCNGGHANHVGLGNLGPVALNALAFPVTMTVAQGPFRIMKGLVTPDRRFMSHDLQIGY